MTDLEISGLTTVVLCVLMISAVINDIRVHRISNVMVIMVLFLGLLSQLLLHQSVGVANWLSGMAVGFALFIPFYIGGGMGAGDVKLMAAVGSVLGASGAAAAAVGALVAGLPLALIVVLHRYIADRREERMTAMAHHGGQAHAINGKLFTREGSQQRIPYAAAIAMGAIVGLLWTGKLQLLAGVLLP